jgi:hypothetical protein
MAGLNRLCRGRRANALLRQPIRARCPRGQAASHAAYKVDPRTGQAAHAYVDPIVFAAWRGIGTDCHGLGLRPPLTLRSDVPGISLSPSRTFGR